MPKCCYWGLNLSFFLEYLYFEENGEGLFVKVKQLIQLLLSAAPFQEGIAVVPAAGVEGSDCLGRREALFLVFLVAAAASVLNLVPFPLCSPHPSSSLAQHTVQQLGAWKALSSIAQCSRRIFYYCTFFLFLILYFI